MPRIKQIIFHFAFIAVLSLSTYAQPQPYLKFFNEASGYQNNKYITDVFCDSDGLIWIVSFSGISTYDGKEFKSINVETASHSNFLRIKETGNKKKYVIDYIGEVFYISADTLVPFLETNKDYQLESGFTDFYIDSKGQLHLSSKKEGYRIIDSKGNIEIPLLELSKNKQGGELCILSKDGNLPFIASFSPTNPVDSTAKYFYLLSTNLRVLDSVKVNYQSYHFPPSITRKNQDGYLYSDGRGNLISFGTSQILNRHNSKYPTVRVFHDRQNQTWLSTANDGIKLFRTSEGKEDYTVLANTKSILSCQDKEGGVWIYSDKEGLVYMPYPSFYYLTKENGIIAQKHVIALEAYRDRLYVAGENNRLTILDYKENQWITKEIKIPIDKKSSVTDLYFDEYQQKLCLSYRGGILEYKNDKWKNVDLGLLSKASESSIYRFIKRTSPDQSFHVLVDNYFFTIKNDSIVYQSKSLKGKAYSGTWSGDSLFINTEVGVYSFKNGSLQYLAESFELLNQRVYSITPYQNEVWFSIRNAGIQRLKDSQLETLKFNGRELQKGAVIKENESSIWIVARQGTFNYKLNERNELEAFAYARVPQTVAGDIKTNKNAILWGTWNQGVFVTPFKNIKAKPLEPLNLLIDKVLIDGQIEMNSDSIVELSYNQGIIQVFYRAVSYQNWDISYRYRLNGLVKKWTETTQRSVQFTTLPPGKYTFELQVKKGDQYWSDSHEIRFIIKPPIWKNWWFIVISLLCVGFIVYQLIAYRFRHIRREKDLVIDRLKAEQSALRAQMNPHFVFNILSSVQYLVMKKENKKAINFLNIFAGLMRKVLDYSSYELIRIEEEVNILKDYLALEQLRMENSFDYFIEIEEDHIDAEAFIPPFLIQPFIENAIHHGLKNKDGEKKLWISFKKVESLLQVEIKDNGIGRQASSVYNSNHKRKRKSHGIRLIKERLKLHNDREKNIEIIDVTSENGIVEGTLCKILIRIIYNESLNNR